MSVSNLLQRMAAKHEEKVKEQKSQLDISSQDLAAFCKKNNIIMPSIVSSSRKGRVFEFTKSSDQEAFLNFMQALAGKLSVRLYFGTRDNIITEKENSFVTLTQKIKDSKDIDKIVAAVNEEIKPSRKMEVKQ